MPTGISWPLASSQLQFFQLDLGHGTSAPEVRRAAGGSAARAGAARDLPQYLM